MSGCLNESMCSPEFLLYGHSNLEVHVDKEEMDEKFKDIALLDGVCVFVYKDFKSIQWLKNTTVIL